jgi:hypothetical protein
MMTEMSNTSWRNTAKWNGEGAELNCQMNICAVLSTSNFWTYSLSGAYSRPSYVTMLCTFTGIRWR